ncbi:uncharacterized protein LOC135143524 [Zophobas morio]|uniref:uncharacterized protein LOC135143524 n=1 Tax=Zophobas morio TaxID=2755281 RepID=UPI003082E635
MRLGLVTYNGLISCMNWCPGSFNRQLKRLGILAVCFSSPVLCLYHVPHPDRLNSANLTLTFLSLPPLRVYNIHEGAYCSSLAWKSVPTFINIAVGTDNGIITIFDVSMEDTDGNNAVFMRWYAHEGPVTCLCYCEMTEHLLLSAGVDGSLLVWDVRDVSFPLFRHDFGNAQIYDCIWSKNIKGPLCSLSDGRVLFISLLLKKALKIVEGKEVLRGISFPPLLKTEPFVILCCSEGGELFMTYIRSRNIPFPYCSSTTAYLSNNSNSPQNCESQEKLWPGVKTLLSNSWRATDILYIFSDWSEPYVNQPKVKKHMREQQEPQAIPPVFVALHKVKYCPSMTDKSWFAYGGWNGLVRLRNITSISRQFKII